MRKAGPTPPPSGKKWRVDLEAISAQGRALRQTKETQEADDGSTLVGPQGARALKTLYSEHARFKQALEMIAAGADVQVAQEALGTRRTYDELAEENRQLVELVNMYQGTLEAIRLGLLKAEDLPQPPDDENVDAPHSETSEHPSENG